LLVGRGAIRRLPHGCPKIWDWWPRAELNHRHKDFQFGEQLHAGLFSTTCEGARCDFCASVQRFSEVIHAKSPQAVKHARDGDLAIRVIVEKAG
jgi:hypothetical protein